MGNYGMGNKEFKKLTWKYFWKYKILEIIAFGFIILFAVLGVVYETQISNFITNYEETINAIMGIIFILTFSALLLYGWIMANWSMAKENARKKLGIANPEIHEPYY